MSRYRLNRKSFEILKAMIRAGNYTDSAWVFTNATALDLLGNPPNWTQYGKSFLGYEASKPEYVSDNGEPSQTPHADWFDYAFTPDGVSCNLNALRDIAKRAAKAGEGDIADAAIGCLEMAAKADADKKPVTGEAMDRTINFSAAPARLQAAAGEANPIPRFFTDAYTGGEMQLDGFDVPVVVDLDGVHTGDNPNPPGLLHHDRKLPVGHTTDTHVESGVLKMNGLVSAVGKHVDDFVASAKNGFPWQASIGAKIQRGQRLRDGESAEANGRTWQGPKIISRKTFLEHIAFLPLGADSKTHTRIAASAAKGSTVKAKKKFVAWAKAHGFKATDLVDDGLLSAAKLAYKAAMKCEADDAADEDEEYTDDDGKKDEGKKGEGAATQATIQASAAGATNDALFAMMLARAEKAVNDQFLANAKFMTDINARADKYRGRVDGAKIAELQAQAIAKQITPDKMELELVQAARPDVKNFYANTGKGAIINGNILAAAASASMVKDPKIAFAGLDEKSANIAASMRGISLHKIIAQAALAIGMHCSAGSIDDNFLIDFLPRDKAAHKQQIQAAMADGSFYAAGVGGFSTMSLTGITENLQNKMMLEAYKLQASVVDDIAYQRDTTDLKIFKVYRLTASGDLAAVGPTGEIKSISLQDASYSNQVTTNAVLLVLTRENILNDDMGALTQSSQILGRKAALFREKAVLTTWLSGLTTVAPGPSTGKTANTFNFWSSGAANYLSGASSALSVPSVQSAVQKFLQQKDDNGDPIALMPDRLLVCPELQGTADNLFNGANLVVTSLTSAAVTTGPVKAADTASQAINLNQHKGKYRPLVSPYLGGSSSITGASATQWALLTEPTAGAATVQVGYLRGQRTPISRQVELAANYLGIGFQVIYDFGVALLDWRTGVYSAGA